MLFFIGRLCMSRKNAFIAKQKISLAENFTNFTQSRFLTHKNFFCTYLSSLSANISNFYKPKAVLSHKPFLLPSKATFFCPPPPIRTTLNLLFAKNTTILLISALNPYAVKPERRTDSNHCRRYPENLRFSALPVT